VLASGVTARTVTGPWGRHPRWAVLQAQGRCPAPPRPQLVQRPGSHTSRSTARARPGGSTRPSPTLRADAPACPYPSSRWPVARAPPARRHRLRCDGPTSRPRPSRRRRTAQDRCERRSHGKGLDRKDHGRPGNLARCSSRSVLGAEQLGLNLPAVVDPRELVRLLLAQG
jgi:hypothetical protein